MLRTILTGKIMRIAIVILICALVLSATALWISQYQLPSTESTLNPHPKVPRGFPFDVPLGDKDISFENVKGNSSFLILNRLPPGYQLFACREETILDSYYILYGDERLSGITFKEVYGAGAIVQTIYECGYGIPSWSSESLREYMKNLAINCSHFFKIGSGEWFGYGYIFSGSSPWGSNGTRICLCDGTWIGIDACLHFDWIIEICKHLTIVPRTTE